MHKAEVGPHSTVTTSIRASRPAAPGSILGIPDFFTNSMLTRFNDSTLLREWTVQSLIVARTHPLLVSGKIELQKRDTKRNKREVCQLVEVWEKTTKTSFLDGWGCRYSNFLRCVSPNLGVTDDAVSFYCRLWKTVAGLTIASFIEGSQAGGKR